MNRRYIEKFQTPRLFRLLRLRDDLEAASALFGAAEEWLREGMKEILGPFNFSTNEEGSPPEGLRPYPMVMMPYNPEYVPPFRRVRPAKKKELWAWYVQKDTVLLSTA